VFSLWHEGVFLGDHRLEGSAATLYLTYNDQARRVVLLVNGKAVVTAWAAAPPTEHFMFGGRVTTESRERSAYTLGDILVYRSAMADRQVANVFAGRRILRSMEAWLPLNHSARKAVNRAVTSAQVDVSGVWRWDIASAIGR
jgi:hypothetical protein